MPLASNVHYYKCDLTNYEQLQIVAEKIREQVSALPSHGVPKLTTN